MAFTETQKQLEAIDLIASEAKNVLLYGGSRSGKTAIFIKALYVRACFTKSRHVILRFRFNHAKASLWYDTMPKVAELMGIKELIHENKSDWFYEFPNGSTIWIGGLDDKERTEKILGNEYSTVYFNEVSQIDKFDSINIALTRLAENSGLRNMAFYDCNPPASTHWVYKLFIKGVNPKNDKVKVKKRLYACMKVNPEDNSENLPNGYIEDYLQTLPDRMRRRFYSGEFVDDVEGALWSMNLIEKQRVDEPPDLVRIGIAIDPAMTAKEGSNETGIIIGGVDSNGYGYILEDLSGIYDPDEWAKKTVWAYYKWNADIIIAEVNQGGDLVEKNIRTVDSNVSYDTVTAKRGKYTRAEPVSSLYKQGKVFHVGIHPELEDQQTTWIPGDDSPDRVDAVVWFCTYFMINNYIPYVG